jgi:sugar transferase (PEP-CTERM/EpsH1 system associated)
VRILYLSHRLPYPPDKGEKIRAYHQILHLARRHEIHVVAFAEERRELEQAEGLRRHCASVEVVHRSRSAAERAALAALLSRRSLSVAAFDSRELRRLVEARQRSDPPDVILVYTAAMAPYAEDAGVPRLVDFVDVDSEKWKLYAMRHRPPRSLIYAIEARRLAAFEDRVCREFEHSASVSEMERQILAARVPGLRHTVIPMGVDLDYFRPRADAGTRGDFAQPVIVFVGVMDYFPNADAVSWFAEDVFPLVRPRIPGVEFRIVGRRPTRSVRALARQPGVTVTGGVADVRPHLADAALAVAPFRITRGVQSKVLEAMASGLPVVGTRLAFQALDAGEEDGVRAADTPPELADEVVAVLRNRALRHSRGADARRYVERNHRWESSGSLLESVLTSLVDHRRTSCATPSRPAAP